jgi:hypothetical protein
VCARLERRSPECLIRSLWQRVLSSTSRMLWHGVQRRMVAGDLAPASSSISGQVSFCFLHLPSDSRCLKGLALLSRKRDTFGARLRVQRSECATQRRSDLTCWDSLADKLADCGEVMASPRGTMTAPGGARYRSARSGVAPIRWTVERLRDQARLAAF